MARILLTGATGRLGSALLPYLLTEGHSVRAVVRQGGGKPLPAGVEKIEFDLSSGAVPQEAFAGIDTVVHLAALVGDYPYETLVQQNAYATKNLLSSCPPTVSKAILASSISIYGERKGEIVEETAEAKADSAYGKSKLLSETFAREYGINFSVIALRFGMIYGPAFTEGYYQVFERLQAGKMGILGDGKNRLPLLHINDAVRSVLLSLNARTQGFRAYNIVGSETPTQEWLLRIAAQSLSAPIPKSSTPIFIAKAGIAFKGLLSGIGLGKPPSITADNIRQLTQDRAYSCEKAKEELGFEAKIKLADGIKQMAGIFLSSHPRAQAAAAGTTAQAAEAKGV